MTDPHFWHAELRWHNEWVLVDEYGDEQGPYHSWKDLWEAWAGFISNWEPSE